MTNFKPKNNNFEAEMTNSRLYIPILELEYNIYCKPRSSQYHQRLKWSILSLEMVISRQLSSY